LRYYEKYLTNLYKKKSLPCAGLVKNTNNGVA
jgi:hypothetical protein